jgi:hypothetical protein
MAKRNLKPTGEILPRDYGLMLEMPGWERVFVSPMKYALAQLLLWNPQEIQGWLSDWAAVNETSYEEAEQSLSKGISKKRDQGIIDFSRSQTTKPSILKAKKYGNKIQADVKSKTRGHYFVTIPEFNSTRDINIAFPGATCHCLDRKWGDLNGKKLTPNCVHISALEIALAEDTRTRESVERNITALPPADRESWQEATLPFTFNFFKPDNRYFEGDIEVHRALFDMIMQHYAQGKSHFEVSSEALKNPRIYSPPLAKAIMNPNDRAKFAVFRGKEKETIHDTPELSSTRSALAKLDTYLSEQWQYVQSGYSREFVGTPWEVISRRFVPRGPKVQSPVYSVCTQEGMPPLIVRHQLKHKARKWVNSSDPMPEVPPFARINQPYESIEDATRRNSTTTVILPFSVENGRKGIPISQNLRQLYESLISSVDMSKEK